ILKCFMRKIAKHIIISFFLISYWYLPMAQIQEQPQPKWTQSIWDAEWIAYPKAGGKEYGVFLFRKAFEWNGTSRKFIINLSADNRYRLFVNGKQMLEGPARSDPNHWVFETVDIAPLLNAGRNLLAVQVWNMGEYKAHAQMSVRTAL